MPPKASQDTTLSADQVQLLCQVVQHSGSPKKESWDAIAQKLNITNGNAAQQRFGRLLKALKSADPSGNSDGGIPKLNATGGGGAPGKQNGSNLKTVKAKKRHAEEEEEEEENENELSDKETPSKKRKSEKQGGTPKWKSLFAHKDDVVKVEDGEYSGYGAATAKTEHELDREVVGRDSTL